MDVDGRNGSVPPVDFFWITLSVFVAARSLL